MPESREFEFYKIALEIRRFEIENFWRRSLFFWGFIVATYAAYTKAATPLHQLVIAQFGLVTSFSWYLVNRGSKYWQEIWEKKVIELEQHGGVNILFWEPPIKERLDGAGKYSVSRITILLSLAATAAWLPLIGNIYKLHGFRLSFIVSSCVTLVLVVLFLTICRSSKLSLGRQG
jgi:hypothetical protein